MYHVVVEFNISGTYKEERRAVLEMACWRENSQCAKDDFQCHHVVRA